MALANVQMQLVARRQAHHKSPRFPLDYYDPAILSPKSVRFSERGDKVFVNALEGKKTLVYDRFGFHKLGEFSHDFTDQESRLFEGIPNFGYALPAGSETAARFNQFSGKPVEMETSHGGKYLWLPFYRRDFDVRGVLPSAIAIVNTITQRTERVISSGPIPKNIRSSHRGHLIAVTHWGDNAIGLFDIRGRSAKEFQAIKLLVDGKKMDVLGLPFVNRDEVCGHCVRGLAFSPDDRFLFVGRMAGDGISVFDISVPSQGRYLGTLYGLGQRPRDLECTDDALIISFNGSGEIAKVPLAWLLPEILQGSASVPRDKIQTVLVGEGLRSIEMTRDGQYVFVAVNNTSEVVAVDLKKLKVERRLKVDSYPVGLGLSPDERQLWVTAQGRKGVGGNSVMVIQLRRPDKELVATPQSQN